MGPENEPVAQLRIVEAEVARIQVEPGDIILVRIAEPIPMEPLDHLYNVMTKTFPDNKVIIANNGTTLEVLRPVNGETEDGK